MQVSKVFYGSDVLLVIPWAGGGVDQTLDMEVVFTRPKAATAELTLIMLPTSHGHMKNLKFTFEITSSTILTNMKT